MSLIVQSNYLLLSHIHAFEKNDCVFISACMCSCVYFCLSMCNVNLICTCVCVCIHVHVHVNRYMCTHACAQTYECMWGRYIISQAFGDYENKLNLALLLCHFIQFRILWKIIILCGLEFIFTVNSDVLGSFNVLCLWASLLCCSFLECSLMPGDSWQLIFVCIKISQISME